MDRIAQLMFESVINSDTNIKRYDIKSYLENVKNVVTDEIKLANLNSSYKSSVGFLEKALESFKNIIIDKKATQMFIAGYTALEPCQIRYLNTEDKTYFKPQYLNQYLQLIQETIDLMIKGKAPNVDLNMFASNEAVTKVKKQVVKTSLPYEDIVKNLNLTTPVSMVTADTDYIRTKVIPFISKYDNIKQETIAEMNAVINAVKEAEDTVKSMVNVLGKADQYVSNDETKKKLNVLAYNAFHGVQSIIAFMVALAIRKLDILSGNVISCNELYLASAKTVSESTGNIFPTDSNSLSEDLIDGKIGAYKVLADRIYEFYANMFNVNALDIQDKSEELMTQNYDKSVYENIAKSFIEISNGLDIIAKEGGEYILVFSDIINKSGLGLNLSQRFQNDVAAIDDLSQYDGGIFGLETYKLEPLTRLAILTEIHDYADNMEKIASIIKDTSKKILLLIDRFSSNVNGEFKDLETINELKIFLGSVKEQYDELVKDVAIKFYRRLKSLSEILDKSETRDNESSDTVPVETSSNLDFSEAAYESILKTNEELYNSLFKALQESYVQKIMNKRTGVSVKFEDGETPVDVTDPNAENTPAPNAADILKENLETFKQDAISKYGSIVDKIKNKQNKWVAENEEELVSRCYSNNGLQMLPYNNIPPQKIINDINNVARNVAAITPEILQSCNEPHDVHVKVFSSIPGYTDPDTMIDGFVKYYKGNSDELEPIANTDLKNKIKDELIPYVSNFYVDNGFASQVCTGVANIIDNTKKLVDDNATNNDNMNKASWISDAVKKYSGSVMNATRDRVTDYMKALNDFVPKNASGHTEIKTGTEVVTGKDNNEVPAQEPLEQPPVEQPTEPAEEPAPEA